MKEILAPLLQGLLIPIAGVIGVLLGKLIMLAISNIKNDMVQRLAYMVVDWAEGQFPKLEGKEQFKKAVEKLAKKLNISVSDAELAIESAYQSLRKELPKKVE